jgi:hypothetical protein
MGFGFGLGLIRVKVWKCCACPFPKCDQKSVIYTFSMDSFASPKQYVEVSALELYRHSKRGAFGVSSWGDSLLQMCAPQGRITCFELCF